MYLAGLALGLVTACASPHVTRYPALSIDTTTEHCRAENIGRLVPLLPEEQAILDDEDRRRDERTIALMLERAARDVAAHSDSVEACLATVNEGEALFVRLLRRNQANLAGAGGFEPAEDAVILEVQKRITDLWRADQSARATLVSLPLSAARDARFWANRLASAHTIRMDVSSSRYLESLLEDYDWIDRDRFGHPVSAHAWLLIQHADNRVDLQAKALSRMEPYLASGGIKPANYAYLWDRVAVNSGRPQRYGTQPIWTCVDDKLELAPIEDRERADTLRQALAMNSVAAQLAEMSRTACGASER